MLLSPNTLKVLAETSETAREVVGEWGWMSEKHVAFMVTPDGDDLHISVVDGPLIKTFVRDLAGFGSVTKVKLPG